MNGLVTNPAGHAPARRLNSVRRTSTLDTTWPDGREGDLRVEGRCRDLLTADALQDTHHLRTDSMVARLNWERVIHSVDNDRLDLSVLHGARGGGHLRAVLDEHIHEERMEGSPLYLLLDDISGVSLVSGWAWSRWEDEEQLHSEFGDRFEERRKMMAGVCTGFAEGSSALDAVRPPRNNPQVVPLPDPQDPIGWHELPDSSGPNFRRARRVDVWREGDCILMDVGFQDSGSDPQLGRVAIHEYEVHAEASVETGELQRIEAIPHVLPFAECPGAIANIQQLVGTPMNELRTRVIELLPGTRGCTHLNDMLRGMAEVPVLASYLGRL